MARLGLLGFLAVAVVFHFAYIYTIFDIYFVSPIVHGMRQYQSSAEAPAKRLFLIVGSLLPFLTPGGVFPFIQAHKPPFIKEDQDATPRRLAPYLRSRALDVGAFGVSHTRMPTESRPGHVALIAGLYEDVSSVTTGWKLNPVNFDSVFNQSRHTWSWGSPDILAMFKEGATPGKVDAFMYGEEEEDFTADATKLDTWVFNNVRDFFEEAKKDGELNKAVNEDKLVFFLHLLGLDTTGHAYRPYSQEYLRNIEVVDAGVEEIVNLVESFYENDGRTSWVFTADHGMSDWGSHGDGHPDNTRTPLIAWGAGVRKPNYSSEGMMAPGHDDFSADWDLQKVERVDVDQADIATLMAYLAGLNFPANSVGVLPLGFLNASEKIKAESIFSNAQQILEMYNVKEEAKKVTQLNFVPFAPLQGQLNSSLIRSQEIQTMIDSGQYDTAINLSEELIRVALNGLRYMQTYDWLFLRSLVSIGYLGWIAFALTSVIELHVVRQNQNQRAEYISLLVSLSVLIGLYSMFFVQRSPWSYYVYAVFPAIFWWQAWQSKDAFIQGIPLLLGDSWRIQKVRLFISSTAIILLLEAIVLGYFHREVFTWCFCAATSWPFFYGWSFVRANKTVVAIWVICCFAMSSFTLLPVIKEESLLLINLGGMLMLATGLIYIIFGHHFLQGSGKNYGDKFSRSSIRSLLGCQCGLILLSMIVTSSSVQSLQAKQGLALGNQVLGWVVLGSSLLALVLHRYCPLDHYLHRLMILFLTFSPIFVILTISYEGLFYVSFCATLASWVQLEWKVYQRSTLRRTAKSKSTNDTRPLEIGDIRIALFFFFFIQAAFFGTGNVASLSSFSLESVYRLIPIFNPFAMTSLLLFKLLIPFAIISANLGVLNRMLRVSPSALFMVVMAVSDILTLNFFYMVKDEGSWLDIGTTISHFVIASLLCVFVAMLEFLSELVVGSVYVEA